MHELTASELEKTLYTTSKPDATEHTFAVTFDNSHAVSVRHLHSSNQIGDKVVLYNLLDPTIQVETVVSALSNCHDIIVFESPSGGFENFPCRFTTMHREQSYTQLGISPTRQPSWRNGTVIESRVGFSVGLSHGKIVDSGSAIFTDYGEMIGVSIGNTNFSITDDLQNLRIQEEADDNTKINIIYMDTISGISGVVGPGFSTYSMYSPTCQASIEYANRSTQFKVVKGNEMAE